MFSVLKKVFGGIVTIFVVIFIIGACFGESDEGSKNAKGGYKSTLMKDFVSLGGEEQIKKVNKYIKQHKYTLPYGFRYTSFIKSSFDKDCEADDKNACRKAELWEDMKAKCEKGDTQLCMDLVKLTNYEGFYEELCNQNDAESCYVLKKYEKACNLKYGGACNNLGVKYEYGDGGSVERNYITAKSYYDKACKLGSKKGCENAKKLAKERGL